MKLFLEQNVSKTAPASGSAMRAAPRTLDARTIDDGKIRVGAGCRIRVLAAPTKRTADAGRIRMGAGCRIRSL